MCSSDLLETLYKYLGDNIDLLGIDGQDFGSQRAELFSPDMFEQFYLPYYKTINDWVHQHTPWKTWKHCCGSIPKFMPHFVASGLDCLNPVQCSAAGMDAVTLKRDFGDELTFWGGGVDTQHTLPFGTPDEVYEEVSQRVKTFGPGGGFVFNAIHNVQHGTTPQNFLAMMQAVKDQIGRASCRERV